MTDAPGLAHAEDERRHRPTPGAPWEERWWFDFAAADGSIGGYARLALRPEEGVAWFWAAVVGVDRPLVALRAHDVRLPARGLEIRSDGVWACLTCETPLEHWSIGLEAFGAVLEDPLEAWGQERGDRLPMGFDLEWEATGPGLSAGSAVPTAYGQWCEIHGDVLLGDERISVAATGHREHAWGTPEFATAPGWRAAVGPTLGPGVASWARSDHRDRTLVTESGSDGLPRRARLDGGVADGGVLLEPVAWSPVLVPDRRVVHALCRSERSGGVGWATWWSDRPSPATSRP